MKRKLYIAICDDDLLDLQKEQALIEDVLIDKNIEYHFDTFTSPTDLLMSIGKYSILFLDVEMGDISGIKIADAVHKNNQGCLIFFVTNHEHYMDDALNKHAFRFWVKPINKARLIYGIKSAINEIKTRNKYITIISKKREKKILLTEIIYIYHNNRETHIVTTHGRIDTYDPFRKVIAQLAESCFGECHASYCVNFHYIYNYDKIALVCKYQDMEYKIPVSRRKYNNFD